MTVRPGADPREAIARQFHERYERLAQDFGYETREDSRRPWHDVPEQNRHLMLAVVGELLRDGVIAATGGARSWGIFGPEGLRRIATSPDLELAGLADDEHARVIGASEAAAMGSERAIVHVARCPVHGLHGCRDRCFECGGPVEQVAMVPVSPVVECVVYASPLSGVAQARCSCGWRGEVRVALGDACADSVGHADNTGHRLVEDLQLGAGSST